MAYSIYVNRRKVSDEVTALLSIVVRTFNGTNERLRINKRNLVENKLADLAKRVASYDKVNTAPLKDDMIPAIETANDATKQLYANDVALVLGANYTSPAKFMITFAGRNSVDPIIRLAQKRGVKIINLSDPKAVAMLAKTIKKHYIKK